MNLKDFEKLFKEFCETEVRKYVEESIKRCETHGTYLPFWWINRGGCPKCGEEKANDRRNE